LRRYRARKGLLGVRYRALADGDFNHTTVLLLLDADGRVVARTEQVGGRPDPAFLAAVRRTLAGH
jgi:protein SCO1/2